MNNSPSVTNETHSLPVMSIGLGIMNVTWSFGDKIQPELQPKLHDAVKIAIARFNNDSNSLQLRQTEDSNSNCLKIEFSKGKFVSQRRKNIAYVINFFGMLVAPIVGFIAGVPGIVLINYFPRNIVSSNVWLSSGGLAAFEKYKRINVWTWVLFVNAKQKEDKLITDFSNRLYNVLKGLELRQWNRLLLENAATSINIAGLQSV
ncbi:hypothetical protein JHJ32_21835 [Parapedobacter sp. ISTM3]|uniref:hypothetical protein n=1 Tax=Parapedobacter sp. ISTM3 TaxID=2800130 RepID=UPI001907CD72|nr:hypothetical protein [Parapedobacter sp. ISTM3]MBK1442656.1 hypothetical protein [Parapedobacter sp. ISTM3]